MQTGQCPVAAPLLRLVQIVTEAGIVDILIHCGGHFQDNEARGIVTGTASGARVGRTDRTGKAAGNRGADEPTEAAFNGLFSRPGQGTGRKVIVREQTARPLRERRRAGRPVTLVEGVSVGDTRLEVKGRELLGGKGEHGAAHSGSSLQ